jgi:hypothetical protein
MASLDDANVEDFTVGLDDGEEIFSRLDLAESIPPRDVDAELGDVRR